MRDCFQKCLNFLDTWASSGQKWLVHFMNVLGNVATAGSKHLRDELLSDPEAWKRANIVEHQLSRTGRVVQAGLGQVINGMMAVSNMTNAQERSTIEAKFGGPGSSTNILRTMLLPYLKVLMGDTWEEAKEDHLSDLNLLFGVLLVKFGCRMPQNMMPWWSFTNLRNAVQHSQSLAPYTITDGLGYSERPRHAQALQELIAVGVPGPKNRWVFYNRTKDGVYNWAVTVPTQGLSAIVAVMSWSSL